MTILGAIVMLIGSLFSALAALGVLRFPDVYTRLHAATKAGTLGAGLILLGAGLISGDIMILVRCVLGLVFLILTGPVSGHLLARSALRSRTPLASITSINEYDESS